MTDDAPGDCRSPLAGTVLSEREAAQLERLFKALGDRHRVRIVNLLAGSDDAICVCKLMPALGLAQATVSYHLGLLVRAGVIEREQRGRFGFYRIAPGAFDRLGEIVREPTHELATAL